MAYQHFEGGYVRHDQVPNIRHDQVPNIHDGILTLSGALKNGAGFSDEAHEFWQAAYDAGQLRPSTTSTAPWITATEWDVDSNSFSVVADLNDLVKIHGDGVYSVMIWAIIAEERAVISQYSIFHGVTPPDTYSVGDSDG